MTMCGGRAADPLESRSRRMPRGGKLRNFENGSQAEAYELKEGPDEDRQATSRFVKLDGRTVDALRRYRAARAGLDRRLVRPDALIFGSLNGDHQHPERFSRRFNEAVPAAVANSAMTRCLQFACVVFGTAGRPWRCWLACIPRSFRSGSATPTSASPSTSRPRPGRYG